MDKSYHNMMRSSDERHIQKSTWKRNWPCFGIHRGPIQPDVGECTGTYHVNMWPSRQYVHTLF